MGLTSEIKIMIFTHHPPLPHSSSHLPLSLLVTYIGKGGYWEGKAGGKEGWFPRLAIKEFGDDEFDYATLTRKDSKAKMSNSEEPRRQTPLKPSPLPERDVSESTASPPSSAQGTK